MSHSVQPRALIAHDPSLVEVMAAESAHDPRVQQLEVLTRWEHQLVETARATQSDRDLERALANIPHDAAKCPDCSPWLRPRPPRDLEIEKHVTHPGPLASCTRPACRR